MARSRSLIGKRPSLERLGVLPRTGRDRALIRSVTLADGLVGAVCLLAVVVVTQSELVAALITANEAVLRAFGGHTGAVQALGGTLVVVGGLGALGGVSLVRLRRLEPGSWRNLLVFGLCCVACTAAARVFVSLDAAIAPRSRGLVYLTPLAAFSVLLTVLYGQRRAIAASLLMALFAGLAVQAARRTGTATESLPVFVVLLCGAQIAVVGSARIRRRTQLLGVGLLIGLAHVAAYVGFALLGGKLQVGRPAPPELLWGLSNGLAVGVLMTVLLPFVELGFNVATDIRLLELSDAEQPLLRSLVTLAPSTDNHSRRVAILADAAAEAIGANPLAARVGAYYHDVGKVIKPTYFIENLGGGESPHDRLRPTLSALIIAAHVRDGIELGEDARLPAAILDIIAQHHGTSVIEFFYQRHLEDARGAEPLDESLFRYPGPKPRSKEAAIVLLADAIEAASRTLGEPLPARIRALVRRIVANKLHDGQLADSGLTLTDLAAIEQTFFRILCAMHHTRIEYPAVELDRLGRRR
jgi:putative nucleotidyltransferase with HDIG domain